MTCRDCGESHGPRCAWLNTCQFCAAPTDDHEATAKDVALVDPERKCEQCFAEMVSAAKRQASEDAREAYGDYLRDEGKGSQAW